MVIGVIHEPPMRLAGDLSLTNPTGSSQYPAASPGRPSWPKRGPRSSRTRLRDSGIHAPYAFPNPTGCSSGVHQHTSSSLVMTGTAGRTGRAADSVEVGLGRVVAVDEHHPVSRCRRKVRRCVCRTR